ncbi:phosphate ABC transporter substrate-binding protein PstS [soil metagenome]
MTHDLTSIPPGAMLSRRVALRIGAATLSAFAGLRAQAAGDAAFDPLPAFSGQPYLPRPVHIPVDAPYLLPDGRIAIVGNDGMDELVRDLNALFTATHPDVRFSARMEGSSTGMPALTAGVTLLAPMTRDLWDADRRAFTLIRGYAPQRIRIGYNGHGPRAPAKTPPAVYVHASNPLAGLAVSQLAQLFTAGSPEGDVRTWGQLGMRGEWSARRIHVYGLRDDGGFATGMRQVHFRGQPFAAQYEALPSREAVLRAVAADPYGIGMVGWIDAAAVTPGLRVLPLAAARGEAFHGPSYEEVRRGLYPLSAAVQFYVDKRPGQPLDPLVREYLRLALSRDGQALVAKQTDSEEGYVPLSPADLARELAALDAL